MTLPASIVTQSNAIVQGLVAATAPPRLQLTGFRASEPMKFVLRELTKIIKGHHGKFIATTSTMDTGLDYGGWFNYFFREASHVAGNDEAFARTRC